MRSSLTARLAVALGVLALAWLPLAVGAQTDAESEREDVQERQGEVAEELDVLQATDEEIDSVLDDIDARLAEQRAAVDAGQEAAERAEAAVGEAEDELAQARRDVVVLEEAIAAMAVESFIHPPSVDLVQSLQALSLSDALLQKAYLDARAKRDLSLLGLLEKAERTAETRAAELQVAAEEAAEAVAAADEALAQLEAERGQQQALANDLSERIDARLAEAAVLQEMDAELADQIAAEQAALLARIPEPEPDPEPTPPTTAPPSTTGGSGGTTTTAPPTTSPPTTTPPTGTPPLRTVQGITVHADIADDVDALLTAARNDGVSLSGWGYRSTESQIALRRAHCGPTYYDIWLKPAGACSPPTAIPGRSLHEQGRAIDFTHNGSTITSESSIQRRLLRAVQPPQRTLALVDQRRLRGVTTRTSRGGRRRPRSGSSWVSPEWIVARPSWVSWASASRSDSAHWSRAERRSDRKHPCGNRVSSSASARASSSACPGSLTRLTSPQSRASVAATGRPVKIMSEARLCPMRRGSRTVPPSTRGTPQRRQ